MAPPPRQVLTVLDAVLAATAAERRRALDEACAGDDDLRRAVESLLALESDADAFLAKPIADAGADDDVVLAAGTRLGPWEIRERIGRGGMGAVYRAVRATDYQSEVAIKLLQGGHAGALPRFHRERQILAQLDHPSIGRLLDGGAYGARPYLVMELVDGLPIDAFCRQAGADLRRRLELFLEVCAAVAYAHRNLIVHRDLKPANILVEVDGTLKLLDFGIAKLLDEGPADTLTVAGSPMTPRYASPEQIQGGPITTATDIYALGLLLHELLTGSLPEGLEVASHAELARRICEQEPARPSLAVRRRAELPPAEAEKLARRLAGDLDAIVLKALRKTPEDRYPSAEALAEDLRRHLNGLPVAARRGSRLYVAGRFVRRHRFGLAVAALALLALAAFVARELRRLEAERQRSARLEAVLEELILTADPDTGPLDADKLLDRAEQQIGALEGEPRLRGELLDSLGWIHRKLGDSERARHLAAESLRLWRELRPADDPDLPLRINNLGALLLDQGDFAGAETLFREALELRLRGRDPDPEEIATNRANLGVSLLYRGRWTEAEELLRQVVASRRAELGPAHPKVAASLRTLAALHHARGDYAAAEPLLRQALALRRAALGDENSEVASVLDLLGQTRFAQGDLDEAADLLGRAVDLRRRLLGEGHPALAWSELCLGQVLLAAGELDLARHLVIRASRDLQVTDLPGSWRLAHAEGVLGGLFAAEGEAGKARPCLEQAVESLSATRGADATYTRQARRLLEQLPACVVGLLPGKNTLSAYREPGGIAPLR